MIGLRVGDIDWPVDTALVTIIREGRVLRPDPEGTLELNDELLFVAADETEEQLEDMLSPHHRRDQQQ
jgi:trk system potassium uptake protein TrkA